MRRQWRRSLSASPDRLLRHSFMAARTRPTPRADRPTVSGWRWARASLDVVDMVLQVLADARQVVNDLDSQRLKVACGADARQHQQLRRAERARRTMTSRRLDAGPTTHPVETRRQLRVGLRTICARSLRS